MAHRFFDFSHLTPSERIELAIALWDSLPVDSIEPPLTEAQRAELDHRLAEYRRNPSVGCSWAEVRERVPKEFHDKQ